MDIKAYIASGILELYVYGSLTEKENLEVYEILQKHPEALEEVKRIEHALDQLSAAVAPNTLSSSYKKIEQNLDASTGGIIAIDRKKTNWPAYIGWAAAVALLIGVFFQSNKNRALRQQVVQQEIEKQVLESKIIIAEEEASKTKSLLDVLRNKTLIRVPLKAQNIDPTAYASVYWDKEQQNTYIDVAGLPDPPPGKVYQVWSLKLNPLTPTSIGILDKFSKNDQKIFLLANPNDSEAFGITLEPEGGSKSPTLEQLYVLGAIAS
ncbi:anti-sigma factor [Aquimarina sp. U1-2]|uniref:anti-sigma factor n=1 Tax=Aquimarina sp. U1-2 TaxID=2823141 RepID=UPI001AECD4AB|nr:anti-sigma factor [Aquimarina sp. U1-2]MBP2833444.1 anti-sigma factor [Aquimarina sp. U1-2]